MNDNIILRKKEWGGGYRRDENGMASVGWTVIKETNDMIIYQSHNPHCHDRHYIFPTDFEVIHTIGYLSQIDFENGTITLYIDKWKHKDREIDN